MLLAIVQVWGTGDTLFEILNVTKSKVIMSSSTDYYLDCGMGNMFGQRLVLHSRASLLIEQDLL